MDAKGTLAIALEMAVGDRLRIPVGTKAELNSTRMALSRERNKMPLAIRDTVRVSYSTTAMEVIIEKMAAKRPMLIEKANGTVVKALSPEEREECERIICMMEEDACSEEEIAAYKKEVGLT